MIIATVGAAILAAFGVFALYAVTLQVLTRDAPWSRSAWALSVVLPIVSSVTVVAFVYDW